jgi:CheY-like chemotaxis protein
MSKVLVVDDNVIICEDLKKHLEKRGYEVRTASTVEKARKHILSEEFDYAIIDLRMEAVSWEFAGVKIINFAKRNQPKLRAIIFSGYKFEEVEILLEKEFEDEIESEKFLKEIKRDYIVKGDKAENSILLVLNKLKEIEQREDEKNCFVIMPFSSTKTCKEDEWTEIFERVITPAVEKSGFNYKCERANIQYGTIIWEILDKLNRSELVIADITDRNPNVLYELGVRHALGGPVIAISQNKDDIPFDLTPYPYKIYGWKTDREKKDFKREIRKAIVELEQNPQQAISPVRKYLDLITADSR